MAVMDVDAYIGKTIKGYEIQKSLGQGGFGAVYRAFQPLIKREVAIKVILPKYANQPDFVRRFEAEAQLVARLEHLHIVSLYDYWRDPTGAYLVMRFLRGGNLQSVLAKEGRWSVDTTARMLDQIATALVVAHRNNVIHRDLKPANILLDEDRNAYLSDFGVAKDIGAKAEGDEEGMVIGSPAYMSPEQIRSQPVTPRTDIYSLGIVLYETLTGRPPFVTDDYFKMINSQLQEGIPSIMQVRSDLAPEIDSIIQTATAKNPLERYESALEMANAFRRAVGRLQETTTSVANLGEVSSSDDIVITFRTTSPRLEITERVLSLDVPEPENPYKGLRAFQEADADHFFGREALITYLLERLQDQEQYRRFLAVVGPSGSGKSSVVKAGILPALRRGSLPGSENWFLLEMVPGTDPMTELETKLLSITTRPFDDLSQVLRASPRGLVTVVNRIMSDPQAELVLVIDQFEEAFTQAREGITAQFLDNLLTAVTDSSSRVRIIVTLRADFYDRPLLYPDFGAILRERTEVVLPLNAEEIEAAIVKPATRVGIVVEPDLVVALVNDVKNEPGALPLLQYALTELFERREGLQMRLGAYQKSGGVLGALARRAEDLHAEMTPAQQEAARQIFLRLVTLGEGTEDTRRRVRWSEIISMIDDDMQFVLDTLGKYRLLTFDKDPQTREPTVEVAHEALIRRWERLREWLDESRDNLRLQRRLTESTEEWLKSNREASFLASGVRLQQLEALLTGGEIALSQNEIDYIRHSITEREKAEEAERIRAARERELEQRSRQRLRVIAVISVAAALLTSVLAVAAFLSFREAEDQRDNAETQKGIAEEQRDIAKREAEVASSLALVSQAQLDLNNGNRDSAIAHGLQAAAIPDPPAQAIQILTDAAFAPGTRRVFTGHSADVDKVALNPDGSRAVSVGLDKSYRLWNVETGAEIRRFDSEVEVWDAIFSRDGMYLLVSFGDDDFSIRLLDAESGEEIRRFTGHSDVARTLAFAPDGKTFVSGSADSSLILWDVENGERLRNFTSSEQTATGEDGEETTVLTGHTDLVRDVAFSRDGTRILSSGADGAVILWDVATGAEIRRFTGHASQCRGVAFSPDGSQVVTGSDDRTIRLWDVETGAEIRRFVGHGGNVNSVAISPNGFYLLTASDDNSLRVWDLNNGDEIYRFLHTAYVSSAVFSRDGNSILSSSGDTTLRLWDLNNGAQRRNFAGHTGAVYNLDISPDQTTALSAAFDSTIILWDLASGAALKTFTGHQDVVTGAFFLPDGKRFVSAGFDLAVILWDIESGEEIRRLEGSVVAVTPDGTAILSAVDDGVDSTLVLWDAETGVEIRRFTPITGDFVDTLAFSPDGGKVLSAGVNAGLILWDVASGTEIRRLEGHDAPVIRVAFNPLMNNGGEATALSGANDNTLILWNIESGEVIQRFEGHVSAVWDVEYSPDGQRLYSASADGTIRIWDVTSGAETYRLNHETPVWTIELVGDGNTLLSGAPDASVRLWQTQPLSLQALIDWTYANRYVSTVGGNLP